MPQESVVQLWNDLMQAGVHPCGLGSRDTLRLEAGMLLYGQDMDTTTSPLESGLSWTIKWEPADRDFIGMGALFSQKQMGIKRKMVGLTLLDKGIMRHGQRVIISGYSDGVVTSGSYSPTLEKSIALARLPVEAGDEVMVDIRGKLVPAKVGKPRFVKTGKAI